MSVNTLPGIYLVFTAYLPGGGYLPFTSQFGRVFTWSIFYVIHTNKSETCEITRTV